MVGANYPRWCNRSQWETVLASHTLWMQVFTRSVGTPTIHSHNQSICSCNWLKFHCKLPSPAAILRQMENSHVHPSTTNITLPSTWLSSPTTSEPTTTPYTTEPVGEPTTVIVTVTEVVRDYRMLIIVVPTAVCTVLLVLVIVTVGVLICLRGRNWRCVYTSPA